MTGPIAVPDPSTKDGLENLVAVANAAVFFCTLCCHGSQEPDVQDVESGNRRIHNLAALMDLLAWIFADGYPYLTSDSQDEFAESPYTFITACNVHFAKAIISYSRNLHEEDDDTSDDESDVDSSSQLPSQRLFEMLYRDLAWMWGTDNTWVVDFEDWCLNIHDNPVETMYPDPPPSWNVRNTSKHCPIPAIPYSAIFTQRAEKRARAEASSDEDGDYPDVTKRVRHK